MGTIILQPTPLLDKLIFTTKSIKSTCEYQDFRHEWEVNHILTTWMAAVEFNLVTGLTDVEICLFIINNQYHVVRVNVEEKCDVGFSGLCISKWPADYIVSNSVLITDDIKLALEILFDLLEAVELTDD